MRLRGERLKPMGPTAAKQAMPAIAVAGVSPVTGDAPGKGEGETSRSEWRLGAPFHRT